MNYIIFNKSNIYIYIYLCIYVCEYTIMYMNACVYDVLLIVSMYYIFIFI